MIEIRTTSEINKYEPKIIGPFTVRQALCVVPGAVAVYFIINICSKFMPIDATIPLCFIPAVIGWAIGWCKPYGMKMEQFVYSIFISRILAPSIRRYRVVNTHEELFKQLSALPVCLDAPEESAPTKQKKRDNAKQVRYKLSPKAYK